MICPLQGGSDDRRRETCEADMSRALNPWQLAGPFPAALYPLVLTFPPGLAPEASSDFEVTTPQKQTQDQCRKNQELQGSTEPIPNPYPLQYLFYILSLLVTLLQASAQAILRVSFRLEPTALLLLPD